MKKQVDQSGRFEDARATVWAYADDESRSLAMSAAVKRKVFAFLKRRGITGARALVRAYTAALFVLLKDVIAVRGVVIELDREYPGYDAEIKGCCCGSSDKRGSTRPARPSSSATLANWRKLTASRGRYTSDGKSQTAKRPGPK